MSILRLRSNVSGNLTEENYNASNDIATDSQWQSSKCDVAATDLWHYDATYSVIFLSLFATTSYLNVVVTWGRHLRTILHIYITIAPAWRHVTKPPYPKDSPKINVVMLKGRQFQNKGDIEKGEIFNKATLKRLAYSKMATVSLTLFDLFFLLLD